MMVDSSKLGMGIYHRSKGWVAAESTRLGSLRERGCLHNRTVYAKASTKKSIHVLHHESGMGSICNDTGHSK